MSRPVSAVALPSEASVPAAPAATIIRFHNGILGDGRWFSDSDCFKPMRHRYDDPWLRDVAARSRRGGHGVWWRKVPKMTDVFRPDETRLAGRGRSGARCRCPAHKPPLQTAAAAAAAACGRREPPRGKKKVPASITNGGSGLSSAVVVGSGGGGSDDDDLHFPPYENPFAVPQQQQPAAATPLPEHHGSESRREPEEIDDVPSQAGTPASSLASQRQRQRNVFQLTALVQPLQSSCGALVAGGGGGVGGGSSVGGNETYTSVSLQKSLLRQVSHLRRRIQEGDATFSTRPTSAVGRLPPMLQRGGDGGGGGGGGGSRRRLRRRLREPSLMQPPLPQEGSADGEEAPPSPPVRAAAALASGLERVAVHNEGQSAVVAAATPPPTVSDADLFEHCGSEVLLKYWKEVEETLALHFCEGLFKQLTAGLARLGAGVGAGFEEDGRGGSAEVRHAFPLLSAEAFAGEGGGGGRGGGGGFDILGERNACCREGSGSSSGSGAAGGGGGGAGAAPAVATPPVLMRYLIRMLLPDARQVLQGGAGTRSLQPQELPRQQQQQQQRQRRQRRQQQQQQETKQLRQPAAARGDRRQQQQGKRKERAAATATAAAAATAAATTASSSAGADDDDGVRSSAAESSSGEAGDPASPLREQRRLYEVVGVFHVRRGARLRDACGVAELGERAGCEQQQASSSSSSPLLPSVLVSPIAFHRDQPTFCDYARLRVRVFRRLRDAASSALSAEGAALCVELWGERRRQLAALHAAGAEDRLRERVLAAAAEREEELLRQQQGYGGGGGGGGGGTAAPAAAAAASHAAAAEAAALAPARYSRTLRTLAHRIPFALRVLVAKVRRRRLAAAAREHVSSQLPRRGNVLAHVAHAVVRFVFPRAPEAALQRLAEAYEEAAPRPAWVTAFAPAVLQDISSSFDSLKGHATARGAQKLRREDYERISAPLMAHNKESAAAAAAAAAEGTAAATAAAQPLDLPSRVALVAPWSVVEWVSGARGSGVGFGDFVEAVARGHLDNTFGTSSSSSATAAAFSTADVASATSAAAAAAAPRRLLPPAAGSGGDAASEDTVPLDVLGAEVAAAVGTAPPDQLSALPLPAESAERRRHLLSYHCHRTKGRLSNAADARDFVEFCQGPGTSGVSVTTHDNPFTLLKAKQAEAQLKIAQRHPEVHAAAVERAAAAAAAAAAATTTATTGPSPPDLVPDTAPMPDWAAAAVTGRPPSAAASHVATAAV